MKNKNREVTVLGSKLGVSAKRRRIVVGMLGLSLLAPIAACGKGKKKIKAEINIAVVAYSYLDRPIFDIIFNGTDLGVSGPFGGTGTITGVQVPLGAQKLSWRLDGPEGMARIGETIKLRNVLLVREGDITAETRYIGLHIYPDETAELTYSEYIPEASARGNEIRRKRRS